MSLDASSYPRAYRSAVVSPGPELRVSMGDVRIRFMPGQIAPSETLTPLADGPIVRYMQNDRNIDLVRSAEVFKALGHPNRLAIFLRMVRRCTPGTTESDAEVTAAVGELAEGLGIAPSTVSHHMKELRNAGLIHMRRAGQVTECWVEPSAIRELTDFLSSAAPESGECA